MQCCSQPINPLAVASLDLLAGVQHISRSIDRKLDRNAPARKTEYAEIQTPPRRMEDKEKTERKKRQKKRKFAKFGNRPKNTQFVSSSSVWGLQKFGGY